ncbi:MAG TPA: M23 family metallopeptidase, partial [Anaerolineaceae bacterium]|nr:M23 family metallopeptidase [Anaerolineaceae bacterium]
MGTASITLASPSPPRRIILRLVLLGLALLLAACQLPPEAAAVSLSSPTAAPVVATRKPVITLPHAPTFTPSLPPATPTIAPSLQLCSPLDEISLPEMAEIVSFPYDPPLAGMDDGHHGVDFSFYRRGDRASIQGLPVRSVLHGTVAAAVTDRPPYGNMIIIETPLSLLPEDWVGALNLPDPQPLLPENPRLNCPRVTVPAWDTPDRSLYLLYAHLDQPPALDTGDPVACGEAIAVVGNTGMSGNPHLHLEVRVGPSGFSFPALAHYDNA